MTSEASSSPTSKKPGRRRRGSAGDSHARTDAPGTRRTRPNQPPDQAADRLNAADRLKTRQNPNESFFVNRLALMLGHHTDTFEIATPSLHLRYFTFNSFRRLLERTGFAVDRIGGYPIGDKRGWQAALWRYPLWLLAKIRPQLFAREIVLTARKYKETEERSWHHPPAGSIRGWQRLHNLWRIT